MKTMWNIYHPTQYLVGSKNRRRFQGEDSSITVLELENTKKNNGQDDKDSGNSNKYKNKYDNSMTRLQCILHESCMIHQSSDIYGNLLSKGSRVLLQGYYYYYTRSSDYVNTNNDDGYQSSNRPAFWVKSVKVLRLSWRPNVIRYFLDILSKQKEDNAYDKKATNVSSPDEGRNDISGVSFGIQDIADALDLPGGHGEANELYNFCKESGSTQRQWRAAELSQTLQDENSRMGTVTNEMEGILEKYSFVRNEFPLKEIRHGDDRGFSPIPIRRKSCKENLNDSGSLRMSLEGSRWQRAKRPQLVWMTNQIQQVVESHPCFGKRPLNILDVGGGRGYLANYIAATLGDDVATVHVIDIDSRTVKNGMMEAKRKSLNVQYAVGDASNSSVLNHLLESDDIEHSTYDLVVALHACGTLSDIALGIAVINNAAFVITPW